MSIKILAVVTPLYIYHGFVKILGAKIIIWVNHLQTQLLLVQTRPTEQRHILTEFQLKKRQSPRHWQDQRNFQREMEKHTYKGNQIQTHHRQTHHQRNLICWMIEITVNRLKIKAIRRKCVVKKRNRTRQNHRHYGDFSLFLLIRLPWTDSMLIIGCLFRAPNSGYPVTKLCP